MAVVITAIFLILASVIYRNWNEIRSYDFSFNYLYLTISFVIFIAAFSMMGIGWGLILGRLKAGLSMKKVISIWFLSQFTRWLPGNFWSVVSIFYLAPGVPRATLALSALLALVFNLIAGVITILVFFYWWPSDLIRSYPVAYLLLPVALIASIFLYPNWLRRIYDNNLWRCLLRRFRKEVTRSRILSTVRIGYGLILLRDLYFAYPFERPRGLYPDFRHGLDNQLPGLRHPRGTGGKGIDNDCHAGSIPTCWSYSHHFTGAADLDDYL